jgi:UDP-glucose 4-epimerase
MKILITGGAGFIGSHITKALCDKKHNVKVIDNLSTGYEDFVDKRAQFIKADIGNFNIISSELKGIDTVIHLAASSTIDKSLTKPRSVFTNNISNGIVLLEAMRKNKVNKIIFSSSAAIYGNQSKFPIKESAIKAPLNPYGASKLAFEEILSSYFHSFGIHSTSLRYFNVYGPNDLQLPMTRAIPMWMKAIIKNQKVNIYWGGNQVRDYVYVTDVAKAHIDVLPLNGLNQFNIGSGKKVKMKTIIGKIEKISGSKLKTINKGERKGDPNILTSDINKIKNEVGWTPKVSLDEGLLNTFNFYKNYFKKND